MRPRQDFRTGTSLDRWDHRSFARFFSVTASFGLSRDAVREKSFQKIQPLVADLALQFQNRGLYNRLRARHGHRGRGGSLPRTSYKEMSSVAVPEQGRQNVRITS